jgi:glycosyltransferase involved in cell wall biosynthesis
VRVVQIISGFAVEGPSGGLGRSGIALCRALDREQIEPVVCALWDYGTTHERDRITQLNEEGIEAFAAAPWREEAPYRSFWEAVKGMRSRLAGTQVDVLHSHSEFGDVAALLLKRASSAKIVARTVHNQEWKKRPLRRVYLTNLMYPLLFDVEIGVSQGLVDYLNARPLARIMGRKARLIYPAFDFSRFYHLSVDVSEKKRGLNIPAQAQVVGTVGRLMKQKGYRFLVQAAAQVLARQPGVYFIIIGEGEQGDELKALARNLGIDCNIIFTGMRSDVEELLAVMDLFVSTSLWEGLPGVILESMASGVPVVATNILGTRELIQDGENGILVPVQDAGATARAIIEMLQQPEYRRTISTAALGTPGKYAIETVAEKYKALYQEKLLF